MKSRLLAAVCVALVSVGNALADGQEEHQPESELRQFMERPTVAGFRELETTFGRRVQEVGLASLISLEESRESLLLDALKVYYPYMIPNGFPERMVYLSCFSELFLLHEDPTDADAYSDYRVCKGDDVPENHRVLLNVLGSLSHGTGRRQSAAGAQLAPSVQADLYLVQTEAHLEERDYAAAQETMEKIVALSEKHDLPLPADFHFKYAQVKNLAGSHAEAVASLTRYLELTGSKGQHYREALELIHQAMQEAAVADDAAFVRARGAGTAAAYGLYLKSYPDGANAAEARRVVAAEADDAAFETALKARTSEAFEAYLASYPDGRHSGRAMAMLEAFRDCRQCPLMVEIPAGSYLMGSPSSEEGRSDDEGPQHRVTIAEPFAVGMYEVTRGEFERFVDDTGWKTPNACRTYEKEGEEWKSAVREGRNWRAPGFAQTDSEPVVCVNWNDAQRYVGWLSSKTGHEYRLLSEAEWEYAARGGTATARYWGEEDAAQCRYANGADAAAQRHHREWTVAPCDDGHYRTAPVGSFFRNAYGLYDVLGNVWEWSADCWNYGYAGAPTDGSAWEQGKCDRRVVRGGSWSYSPRFLRSAIRFRFDSGFRWNNIGFRVARTLTP